MSSNESSSLAASKESPMCKQMLFLLLLCSLFSFGVAAAQAPRPVIIDTDMGSDDWMAILYILNSPDIAVQAITVNGTGLAYCDAGVAIALGLLALADYADIPVSCGSETPLLGENAFPAEWRTNMEAAQALGLPEGGAMAEEDSVSLFTSVVSASPEPITVLALGPLTNLGAAFDADPALADQIAMIYIMGGAVDVAGSGITEDNTTAEWNIYCDPHAARLVFESGAPITLVPLDATNDAPVTMDFVARLETAQESPEAQFVYTMLTGSTEFIESGGFYFWDPLAAVVLTDESLVTLETRDVSVIDVPGAEDGRTKPVGNGPEIRVATVPNVAAFEARFIATLNQ
jgi:pyrimidine-specific ribonucleoside hydrolase